MYHVKSETRSHFSGSTTANQGFPIYLSSTSKRLLVVFFVRKFRDCSTMKLAGIPKLEWACLVVVLFALRSTKAASDRDAARNKLRMLREEIDEFLAQKKQQQSSVRVGSSNERKLPSYKSKSKHDPCVTPVGGKEGFVLLKQPGYLFSPSFWVGCAKSLKVDYKNMLLHIKSLNDIFKDYQ